MIQAAEVEWSWKEERRSVKDLVGQKVGEEEGEDVLD